MVLGWDESAISIVRWATHPPTHDHRHLNSCAIRLPLMVHRDCIKSGTPFSRRVAAHPPFHSNLKNMFLHDQLITRCDDGMSSSFYSNSFFSSCVPWTAKECMARITPESRREWNPFSLFRIGYWNWSIKQKVKKKKIETRDDDRKILRPERMVSRECCSRTSL